MKNCCIISPLSAESPVTLPTFIIRNMYAANRAKPPTVMMISRCFHSEEIRIRKEDSSAAMQIGRTAIVSHTMTIRR